MHLGFLFLISAGICIPLFGRRTGLVVTLICMTAYLLFVGFRPSLVRAVFMSGFGILWSLLSARKIDTVRLLVLSALLQMVLMPADTHSLSFGLSYLALFGRRTGLVVTLICMTAYLLFVGFRPSLVRAVFMSGFGILWSLLSARKIDTVRLLVLSALLQTVLMPADTQSLSFGLSYLALFGILTASGAVERRIPFFIPPSIRSVLAAGITAQAFSAPLLLAIFGEVYPGGVIASVLLTPVVLLLMGSGIFYLIWSASASCASGAVYLAVDLLIRRGLRELAEYIESTAGLFARLPSIRVTGGEGSRWALLWAAVLTLLVLLHYGRIIVSLYRRRDAASTKSRLTDGDSTVPHGGGTRPVAPIWAELPRQSGGAQTNRRAA
jgi:ComEC/Rec2-related protein